ncbi:MAG: hypothetical protein WBW99_12655 [Pseudolabrys sp.]
MTCIKWVAVGFASSGVFAQSPQQISGVAAYTGRTACGDRYDPKNIPPRTAAFRSERACVSPIENHIAAL